MIYIHRLDLFVRRPGPRIQQCCHDSRRLKMTESSSKDDGQKSAITWISDRAMEIAELGM